MNKYLFLLLAIVTTGCKKDTYNNELLNSWVNTEIRDQVFTDSEYNVIKVESATDSTVIEFNKETLSILFSVNYSNDSIMDYDTVVTIPYELTNNTIRMNIRNNVSLIKFKISNNTIIMRQDKLSPLIIKHSSPNIFNRVYYKKNVSVNKQDDEP